MRTLYVTTLFLSSFLLLLVQPMLAKALLPLVGGAPAIWVVTMLFFQLVLLAGYSYAAYSSRWLTPQKQAVWHLVLFGIVLLMGFPLQLRGTEHLLSGGHPEIAVILALFSSVGFMYFILSTHSSLLQRWYHFHFAEEPYHLFSAGNFGSLLGLFAYPFVLEWALPLNEQLRVWSYGFLVLSGLLIVLAVPTARTANKGEITPVSQKKGLSFREIFDIVFPAFIASSLMLGVTLYVTTDVASLPMLWIIPLAFYLLSFVIVYGRNGEKVTAFAQKMHPIIVVLAAMIMGLYQVFIGLIIHFACFFIIALSCHGQIMRRRPSAEKLTSYFFWLSVGGALGGMFNTAAPYMFNNVLEYPFILLLSVMALPSRYLVSFLPLKKMAIVVGAVVACLWVILASSPVHQEEGKRKIIHQSRNFFGVSRVAEFEDHVEYMHGTTTHGIQAKNEKYRLHPVSYYAPIKKLIKALPANFADHPYAILGLGSGTAACFGRKNQRIDFFEIDQAVIDIAQDPKNFTYLRDCPPETKIYLGDGRLELAKRPDARYSLLVLDAFTSDAVPLHLLSLEAMKLYISKMVPGEGIIAFDLSNRHLDLKPFVAQIGLSLGWRPFSLLFIPGKEERNNFIFASEWLFLLPPDSSHIEAMMLAGAKPYTPKKNIPLWTDQYSNIIPAIRWGKLQ